MKNKKDFYSWLLIAMLAGFGFGIMIAMMLVEASQKL